MPLVLPPGAGDPIGLEALGDALATARLDPRDDDAFASLGPLLAQLGRNRTFMGDLAVAELSARGRAAVPRGAGYGPQVMILRPSDGRFLVRANFWPAAEDAVLRASGPEAFFYGFPHDHDFAFLTYGYLGPGYWSDYYEADPARITGVPGAPAHLRFVERARLEPGRLMLYRAHRDVHVQAPPDAFSLSLNILRHDPGQPWRDQYRFDIAGNRVAANLSMTSAEALVAIAAQLGGNGTDIAAYLFRTHPCARMRVTALDALIAASGGEDALAWAEAGARATDARVAGHAERWIARALQRNG
ncbi:MULTISPECIES: hypothetical protein [unclassified Sphingomonas]|uniref:hypothetical protein n=1 Tax=unclassified Sphingomonas TaxID=196159 RepID=UPI00082D7408|nr:MULTISPECIES: hypothetical protein [unclassified Sphingomonas]